MKRRIDPRKIEAVDLAVAAILRQKAPHERIAMVAEAHRTARLLLQAQIMRMNPEWSQEQVQREVVRRLASGTDGPPRPRSGRP